MSDSRFQQKVAVVGRNVTLHFESAAQLGGDVTATFRAHETDDNETVEAALRKAPHSSWTETLALRPNGPKRWTASWNVKFDGRKTIAPAKTMVVSVTLREQISNSASGALNYVRIPGLRVTSDSALRRIMLHEFARQIANKEWEFSPIACESFLAGLTVEQRSILAAAQDEKLVAFVSYRGRDMSRPMFADNGGVAGATKSAHANASFSIFHCHGAGAAATLLTHTNYFCVNPNNHFPDSPSPDSYKFLRSMEARFDPRSTTPHKFALIAEPHHYTVYLRLVNAGASMDLRGADDKICTTVKSGQSVMGSNFIHGGINTEGCWMMYRNYNWPAHFRDQFLGIYINLYRKGLIVPEAIEALAKLGYDVRPERGDEKLPESNSFHKFANYDRNYAYSLFLRDVLGIRPWADASSVNYHDLHATDNVKSIEKKSHKSFPRINAAPPPNDYHVVTIEDDRQKHNEFHLTKAKYLGNNAVGFHPIRSWEAPFADCYIFKTPLAPSILTNPYVAPPPAP